MLGYLQMNMSAEHSYSTKDWINVSATQWENTFSAVTQSSKQDHDTPLPAFQKATQVPNSIFFPPIDNT